jgi:hypothetical protein
MEWDYLRRYPSVRFIHCTECVTDVACSEKMANITGLVNQTYINGTLVNGTWHCDHQMYPYQYKTYTCNLTCIFLFIEISNVSIAAGLLDQLPHKIYPETLIYCQPSVVSNNTGNCSMTGIC